MDKIQETFYILAICLIAGLALFKSIKKIFNKIKDFFN